jgi:hypothetical protein
MSKMKNKVIEEQEKPRIWIEYTTHEEGGDTIDPDDRWSNRTDHNIELQVKKLYKSEPKHLFFKDSIEVEDLSILEKQYVYLVVVRYQTGDTFGTSHGNFKFYSVRGTEDEVIKDRADIEKPRGPNDPYRAWDGYFERLENVEIELLPLLP